jgi:predicted ATPase/DNA-binding SARP family transcriptional activator
MDDGVDRLAIRVLGPVEVVRDGASIRVGGPRMRAVLALLAIRPRQVVAADELIHDVWAGEPTPAAAASLKVYVSRLRRFLTPEAAIEGSDRGYSLTIEPEAVDAVAFERLVRDGTRALSLHRYQAAAELMDAALRMWRGTPFGELAVDGALHAEAVRLEELRVHAADQRLDALLELGRGSELIEALEHEVAANPYRERLWRHLMLALYRSGRQAEALAAYQRARSTLDTDLGIEPGEELRALEAAILRQDVPPPAAARSSGIPAPLTSFVGRAAEIAVVGDLVRRHRLVTLTGVGGAGKTRLAIEVARNIDGEVADGAIFVDVATVTDGNLVAEHVAAALGANGGAGNGLERLAAQVRQARLLLVIDNCEHLRDAVAVVVEALLSRAPDLRILATSREVLGVPGEVAHAVPPLDVPEPDATLEALMGADAIRLLLERIDGTSAPAGSSDVVLRTAARICRELDGLPLAIELAASRSAALGLEQIADRLADRFKFLVSWRRLASARHRTLAEAMDWSYELLSVQERRLLASLSVFGGPFQLDAVAAVCLDGDQDLALDLVERLLDASLLTSVAAGRGKRFRMLETVRQYAAGHLSDQEADIVRRRLAEHVRRLAYAAHLALESPGIPDYESVREELPNIRVALAWAEETDPALGLDIACILERHWAAAAPDEGLEIISAMLQRPDIPPDLRARAVRAVSGFHFLAGENEESVRGAQEALEMYRRIGDHRGTGHLLLRGAMSLVGAGRIAEARAAVAEALATSAGNRFAEDEYLSRAILASAFRAEGNLEAGVPLMTEAAELAASSHDPWWQTNALLNVAEMALLLRRPADATMPSRQGLELAARLQDRVTVAFGLALIAEEAAQLGDDRRAGRLWGALLAERDKRALSGQWELEHAEHEARLRAEPGPEFDLGVSEGRQLSLDAAIDEALLATSSA